MNKRNENKFSHFVKFLLKKNDNLHDEGYSFSFILLNNKTFNPIFNYQFVNFNYYYLFIINKRKFLKLIK